MMKQFIEFPLASGHKSIVEVDIPDEFKIQPVAKAGEILLRATRSLEDALEGMKPTISAIIIGLKDYASAVDQTEVEFGIKVGANSELILASAGAEANLKIKLTWRSPHKLQGS